MPEDEIDALVARAKFGEESAYAGLYDYFAPRVYRFFRFRVASPEQAEDLMQRVFVKMIETLPGYENRGAPFGAWLFRVARNLWIDDSRARRATVPIDFLESAPSDQGDPHTLAAAAIDGAIIRQAVASLPADQRDVITYRFFAGLTPGETATLMNRSEGAVRVLQHRAIGALRRNLPVLGESLAADLEVER